MSFRTRLTSFFVLIVVIPMIAVGFLVFRLINDSQNGKVDARVSGLAAAAQSLYRGQSETATADAQTIARLLAVPGSAPIRARTAGLAEQLGLARVSVTRGSRTLADVGVRTAVAPGAATVLQQPGGQLTVTVSEITAAEYLRDLNAPGAAMVIRQGSRTLATTLRAAARVNLPTHGAVTVGGTHYRAATETMLGFGGPVAVTALSSASASSGSATGSRVLAGAFIAAFLILAFLFSVMASRGLQGQIKRFLQAARRLGSGDFSSPIQTEGNDEFAALAQEFNSMSSQLERRLDELSRERVRLREAIRRIGQTFAANLDRPALLELALGTAMDAVEASAGRISARETEEQPLIEAIREGSFDGVEECVLEAERGALNGDGLGESSVDSAWALSVRMRPLKAEGRTHGLITVVSRGRQFTQDDREVLRSLAAEATLALENVDLHVQVSRQAVTDELTGLSNHGRFQELLGTEIEQVRRYHHSLGLIMLDIDDFKAINDTYGHQQGDIVLKRVARVLADTSREADFPARYGGEEMALILPHTDLEGSYAIAERIRTRVEALRIPRNDGEAPLRVTVSVGVAASMDTHKDELIADADTALYEAKRAGKNRTVRAPVRAANVSGAQ
jgi:diguanylate cyclase (GGDEF)-like protein